MDASELIKKSFIQATNAYAFARGIAKPFDDPQHCQSTQIPASPACNTEAIEAYKNNQGLQPGLEAIMREKFAKAALADEMAKALKACVAQLEFILPNKGRVHDEHQALNGSYFILAKYEALPK